MTKFVVTNDEGEKLLYGNPWGDGMTLSLNLFDHYTEFESAEEAQGALDNSIQYEESHGLNWNTHLWNVDALEESNVS